MKRVLFSYAAGFVSGAAAIFGLAVLAGLDADHKMKHSSRGYYRAG